MTKLMSLRRTGIVSSPKVRVSGMKWIVGVIPKMEETLRMRLSRI